VRDGLNSSRATRCGAATEHGGRKRWGHAELRIWRKSRGLRKKNGSSNQMVPGWDRSRRPPEDTRWRRAALPVLADMLSATWDGTALRPGSERRPQRHGIPALFRGNPPRHFTALAPAVAAMPSWVAVPPLTPMAPTSLPLRRIGTPPSDAIGRAASGK